VDFELPGQLKGPECRRVVTQAVKLRRALDPWFQALSSERVRNLAVVLRVDGSLGSFGSPGIENIEIDGGDLSCDLVVSDARWDTLNDREIYEILRTQVLRAIDICFRHAGVDYMQQDLERLAVTGD
jgi:serine/threonine protein phosphatase PrpC